jgi:hypothetical protein
MIRKGKVVKIDGHRGRVQSVYRLRVGDQLVRYAEVKMETGAASTIDMAVSALEEQQ